jgi:hypothetical protein
VKTLKHKISEAKGHRPCLFRDEGSRGGRADLPRASSAAQRANPNGSEFNFSF